MEDAIREKTGGRHVKAGEPWGEKVVVDGLIITGQNPASAKAVAEAIAHALGMWNVAKTTAILREGEFEKKTGLTLLCCRHLNYGICPMLDPRS